MPNKYEKLADKLDDLGTCEACQLNEDSSSAIRELLALVREMNEALGGMRLTLLSHAADKHEARGEERIPAFLDIEFVRKACAAHQKAKEALGDKPE